MRPFACIINKTPVMSPSATHADRQHANLDERALGRLQTEAISPVAGTMDTLDTLGLCTSFNSQEARVASAIETCLPAIAALIDGLLPRLQAGGRLIYVGAGNSGRIAHMDCAELPVTFSVDESQFLAIVAGGKTAVLKAMEGAEDSLEDGAAEMQRLSLNMQDTVVGISASGRTPFVVGALEVAMQRGALAAAVTNTRPSLMEDMGVGHPIAVLVGPEFVTGSTRLKAGSCAKQVLNMISTCAMIRLGKTHRGLMVDVRANNEKLRARGRRIVRQVCGKKLPITIARLLHMPTDDDDDDTVDMLLELCGGSVKLACAVGLSGLEPSVVTKRLAAADGCIQTFIDRLDMGSLGIHPAAGPNATPDEYFLCIDGGGTKCAVSIATRRRGVIAKASAGSCNLISEPLEHVMQQIQTAISKAIDLLPFQAGRYPRPRSQFVKVWVGIAGLHHTSASHAAKFTSLLEGMLAVSSTDGSLYVTCDTSLLAACLAADGSAQGCVALVAGTGSVAAAFAKPSTGSAAAQVGRAGGWGHLLGDQGSAFHIGQLAIGAALARMDEQQGETHSLSRLEAAVVKHLACDKGDVLSSVLAVGEDTPRRRIGGVAKLVTELAFADADPDAQALLILGDAARRLALLVRPLAMRTCDSAKSVLVLSGALMGVEPYRDLVLDECAALGLTFRETVVVQDVSAYVAEILSQSTPLPSGKSI